MVFRLYPLDQVPAQTRYQIASPGTADNSPRESCRNLHPSQEDQILTAIHDAARLLPIPGPIAAFSFLNPLQALEHLPFDIGLQKGASIYGYEPYLTESQFREHLRNGRIQDADLKAVIAGELGDLHSDHVSPRGTVHDLRLAIMRHSLVRGPAAELHWFVAETEALRKMRPDVPSDIHQKFVDKTRQWVMSQLTDTPGMLANSEQSVIVSELQALHLRVGSSSIESWSESTWNRLTLRLLWRYCQIGVASVPPQTPVARFRRHRDMLLSVTGEDSDRLVHELLIPFCAAFADQGFAAWRRPSHAAGFFASFLKLYGHPSGAPEPWRRELRRELNRQSREVTKPLDSIVESLNLLGVMEEEREEYLLRTLLALGGWAGMLNQLEQRGDRVPVPAPNGTLLEYLAIRLIVERFAVADVARRKLGYTGSLSTLRDALPASSTSTAAMGEDQRAFLVFQLSQLLGWTPGELAQMTTAEWCQTVTAIESFTALECRRYFQLAYERRFRIGALDAMTNHTHSTTFVKSRQRFQSVYCIDAREESFRRHVEEVAPDTETFAAAGFFGVAMYYRGAASARFAASCPVVTKPRNWVTEEVAYPLLDSHRRRRRVRQTLGAVTRQLHLGSRRLTSGALLMMLAGVFASIPLVARVLFPRWTARLRKVAGGLVAPPNVTRLRLEHSSVNTSIENKQVGFTIVEMADIGERMLRDIGLTSDFARLVLFLGHASSSVNNPHKSAYDCGACTRPGGANARAIASILNDIRVRTTLAQRGLQIPPDTYFLGGQHDTCDDTITFSDLDLLPVSHFDDFEQANESLKLACERNSHERCRLFEIPTATLSFAEAKSHSERRAEDLSQARAEYGNATNAMCIVGRRSRTRGLFLDRRPFLMSYDPTQDDDEQTILARILNAVMPVCEGINMQYFLSHVDPQGWGCGSKLPHNVVSLVGVMNGASSDLLTGLPWQGVEIHEPMRCLFVVETTAEAMFRIMDRNPVVGKLVRNGWVTLSILDPTSSRVRVFVGGDFRDYQPESPTLPQVDSSADWYSGRRGRMTFAEIRPIGESSPTAMRL